MKATMDNDEIDHIDSISVENETKVSWPIR